MKHLRYLNKYFYKYRYRFIAGILFVLISNIFAVFPAQVIRHAFNLVKENIALYKLFDQLMLQDQFYNIFTYGLMIFGATVLFLALMKGIFMFFMRQTLIIMSRFIEYDLKNEIYNHYQELDMAFYKRNNTGDLMSRITEDVTRVRMYLGPAIMYSINLIALFIIVISIMLSVNARLTLYVLIPLPVLSLSIYYVNNLINKRSEAIQRQLSNLTSIAQEVFSGIRVVKSYVQERSLNHYFGDECENYKEKSLDLAKVEALFFPLMLLLIGLSTILTIYIGGIEVIKGRITTGNIAEFVIYINMLTWPVTSIGWVASVIQRAAASQKRINEFLNTKPEISTISENKPPIKGQIAFQNVTFTYPDTGIRALKNVSFNLQPGQRMAVIGKTGSGKSTLADLLVRLYDPDEGQILIDGKDIRKMNLSWLRKNIGFVPQDVFLFSDTIRGNILFGSEEMSDDHIIEAAKNASVYNEIQKIPEGFNSVIGERGVTLSGGQKQRISIARSIIKNPQVLVMDDSLSAVDARTEKIILNSFNKILKGKTAIIITHRIFSLIEFDKIIVLEDGQIKEEGTHEELLKKKGLYFELFEMQQDTEQKFT